MKQLHRLIVLLGSCNLIDNYLIDMSKQIENLYKEIKSLMNKDEFKDYMVEEFWSGDLSKISSTWLSWETIVKLANMKWVAEIAYWVSKGKPFEKFRSEVIDSTKEKVEWNTYFSLCWSLKEKDKDVYKQLELLFNINLNGTVWFYAIPNVTDVDTILDLIQKKLSDIRSAFCLWAWIDFCYMLPYIQYLNHYFIVQYPKGKDNTKLQWIWSVVSRIDTCQNFYFLLHKDIKTDALFLVVKEPIDKKFVTILIETINKLTNLNISYTKSQILNCSAVEKSKRKDPTDRKLSFSTIWFRFDWLSIDLIAKWDTCLSEIKKLSKKWLRVSQADIAFDPSSVTWKTETLTGSIKRNGLRLKSKSYSIIQYIDLINWANLFDSVQAIQDNEQDALTEILMTGKYVIKNNHWLIPFLVTEYDPKIIYIWDWITSVAKWTWVTTSQIDIKNNIVTINGDEDVINNNLELVFDLNKVVKNIVHKKAVHENRKTIGLIKFPWLKRNSHLHNTIIVLADSVWDLAEFILHEANEDTKYIAFIKGEITPSVIKSLSFMKTIVQSSELLKKFLKWNTLEKFKRESQTIVSYDEFPKITWDLDLDITALSISSYWEKFENKTSQILQYFLPTHVPFGNKFLFKSVPDGLSFDEWINLLYDVKSSDNIKGYLNTTELRKFKSYSEFFPAHWKKIFLIVWPSIEDKKVKSIANDPEMKTILWWSVTWLYISSEILELMLYVLRYPDFNKFAKYLISKKKVLTILEDNIWDLWHFKEVAYTQFKDLFVDYCVIKPDEELCRKVLLNTTKSKWKSIDLIKEYEKFKAYVKDHKLPW